jgi:hypothetical protein
MRDGGVQNLVPRQDGETLVCMVHRRAPNYKVRHWPAGRFDYATMMSLAWARALRVGGAAGRDPSWSARRERVDYLELFSANR